MPAEASVQNDTMVATMQPVTAPDDPADGHAVETHFESHNFQVRYNEDDVGFPISSAGKTSQQGNCDAARPRWTDHQDMCEGPKCGKAGETLEKALVAMLGNETHGWSTILHKSQSGKVGRRGNAKVCDTL